MHNSEHSSSIRPFYICHHDRKRTYVTPELLEKAQAGIGSSKQSYDTLTTRITTDSFHAKIDTLLANHLYTQDALGNSPAVGPVVPSLSSSDTYLAPEKFSPQLLGLVSDWIDLCSPDPAVYDVSRQVLKLETSFASFCGLSSINLPSPPSNLGIRSISLYANAINEVLTTYPYMKFSVSLPMVEAPSNDNLMEDSLSHLARIEYTDAGFPTSNSGKAVYQNGRPEGSLAEGQRGPPSDHESRSSLESIKKKVRVQDLLGTWDAWNTLRSFCHYNSRLFVDLKIPGYLPHSGICFRWYAEPLRVLTLDTSTFFLNPSGYPVLTSSHRALISLYMKSSNPPVIQLSGVGSILPEPFQSDSMNGVELADDIFETSDSFSWKQASSESQANQSRRRTTKTSDGRQSVAHLRYLRWFQNQQPEPTTLEILSTGYQDYLQAPLQPLADNLESVTYEVFEQDPVKYNLYEKAICNALIDWRQEGKTASGSGGRVVVAVVGAGRGPLVARALNASATTGVPIDLWALEKNQNAFVMLERHKANTWQNSVQLVHSDMRDWKGPWRYPAEHQEVHVDGDEVGPSIVSYPIDIVISELLGSFGDNELSPECLDHVLPLLNPIHGLSIPESYTALLTPIATPKLHSDIASIAVHDPGTFSAASVVCLQKFDYLSAKSHSSVKGPDIIQTPSSIEDSPPSHEYVPSKEDNGENRPYVVKPAQPIVLQAWSFHHGPSSPLNKTSTNQQNARHARLSFELRQRGVCHGLAGYFESVLYPGVELSTNPINQHEKSPDMISWFPIFFPLKTPLYAPDFSTLVVTMFRATDNRKVWYEWMIEAWSNHPGTTGGTGNRLGVTDMMSSKEKGCLM